MRRSGVPLSLTALTGLLLVSVVAAAATGTVQLRFTETASILVSFASRWPNIEAQSWQEVVVLWIRLPRVVLSLFVGGGLAVCGAVMQSVFRNPMAEPGLLGVTASASLGAVLAIYATDAAVAFFLVPVCSFVGALAAVFLVYSLAGLRGRPSVSSLLLSGLTVHTTAAALTSFILSLSLRRFELARQILGWLMGDMEGRSWGHALVAVPLITVGVCAVYAYSRDLDVLLTGDDTASSLGVDVAIVRRNVLVVTSLVTAACVSAVGSVAFVGLLVPHMARGLVGSQSRVLLPASFLGGGALLVLADMLCRFWPALDLRLGVITSLIGGPFFMYTLVRARNDQRV